MATTTAAGPLRLRTRWGGYLSLAVIVVAICSLAGIFFAGVMYVVFVLHYKQQYSLKTLLIWHTTKFYVWAALAPVVFKLARRFRLDHGERKNVLLHVGASVVFGFAHLILAMPLFWVLDGAQSAQIMPTMMDAIEEGMANTYPISVLVYWGLLAIDYGLGYYVRFGQERLRASQLQAQLAESQLRALRMQLNPHFLFNTLHAVTGIMRDDVATAEEMLVGQGDLLRLTLEEGEEQEITLGKEMEIVERYLKIQQMRLGKRLRVKLDVDANVMGALVPSMILQPSVENAITHGIAARIETGVLEIRAHRENAHHEDAMLCLQICDDGPGFSGNRDGRTGLGTLNTRSRLQALYGEAFEFELTNRAERGAMVTIRVPLHYEAVKEVAKA